VRLTRVPARGWRRTARRLLWRSQPGRWSVRGDDPLAPVARSPASGSCGPVRRRGPQQPGGGCAPAPGRALALEHDPCRPRRRPVPLLVGAALPARRVSAAAGPGQPPARPLWGSAIAQADRGPSLGLGGRQGSARRAGSDGSSRSTGRRAGRPRQRSGSVVAGGGHRPAAERPSRGWASPKCVTACGAGVSWPASRKQAELTAIQAAGEAACIGPTEAYLASDGAARRGHRSPRRLPPHGWGRRRCGPCGPCR
jgi:hypothetical protein